MITTYEIEQGILGAIQQIEDLVDKVAQFTYESAVAEADYKAQFASERMNARVFHEKATVGFLDDIATQACEESLRTYKIAEGKVTAVREALRAAQARLDGFRTLASSHRSAGG